MNTRRNAEFWNSDSARTFLNSHLPVVYHLDRISNWAVFGTITFENPALRSSIDLTQIHRQLHGLLNGLAAKFKQRTRNLVFFYSIEGDGAVRHRHAHILLADDRLENATPDQLCHSLTELADRYGIGNCKFNPFDYQKDGVAYAAKIDAVTGNDGRKIQVEPQLCESVALRKRIQQLNSNLDTVRNEPHHFYRKENYEKTRTRELAPHTL